MGIKIIKEKKVNDYTFIDAGLNLEKPKGEKLNVKKDKTERDYRLREVGKLNKLRHKSKIAGGHSVQGHSPVYE